MRFTSIRGRLLIGAVFVLLLLVALNSIALITAVRGRAAVEETQLAYERVVRSEQATAALIAMESAYRLFLITGNTEALHEFEGHRAAYRRYYTSLRESRHLPEAEGRLWGRLAERAESWEREAAAPGMLIRRQIDSGHGSLELLAQYENTGNSRRYFEDIDTLVAMARADGAARLVQFQRADSLGTRRLLHVMVWGTLLVVAIGAILLGRLAGRLGAALDGVVRRAHTLRTGTIAALGSAIHTLAQGDLREVNVPRTDPLAVTGSDEIAELTESLNGIVAECELAVECYANARATLRDLLEETNRLIRAGRDGELSVRGDPTRFRGAYRSLVEGTNRALQAAIEPIMASTRALDMVSRGDLRARVSGEFRGEHARAVESLNDALQRLEEASETMHLTEVRYRAVFESVREVIFQTDAEGRWTLLNPAWKELTGRSIAESIGRSFLERVHEDDRDSAAKSFAAFAVSGDEEHRLELRLVHEDEELRVVDAHVRAVRDAQGTLQGSTGTLVDVTARRTLEARLLQSQKLEAVGQLAGGVAHDFNNLLTAILGFAELAGSGLAPDTLTAKDVEEIRRAALRGANLTRQLLAFSRRQEVKPKVVSIGGAVKDAEELLARLMPPTVQLTLNCEEDAALIRIDPGQFEQVLINLAVNARDALSAGGEITISAVREGAESVLVVSDNGTGMDEATQKRIFEPFFTTKPVGKGTGLGLATVYGIVEQARGRIDLTSAPARGTTFRVAFPAIDERASTGEFAIPRVQSRTPTRGQTLLVVEDESAVRHATARLLRNGGFQVLEARHGTDALRLLETHGENVSLLLTDIVMPELGGVGLASACRQRWPHVAIVFMSGYAREHAERLYGDAPDAVILEKPFVSTLLMDTIRDVLRGQGGLCANASL